MQITGTLTAWRLIPDGEMAIRVGAGQVLATFSLDSRPDRYYEPLDVVGSMSQDDYLENASAWESLAS